MGPAISTCAALPHHSTKLLTALVVLDSDWQPEAMLSVSHDAAHTKRPRVGLRTGESIRADDALTAMLMHSANDACLVLAEHAAGSIEAFAARMNARAAELGMRDSHFVHPCGFDADGQYSTVTDLLRLARPRTPTRASRRSSRRSRPRSAPPQAGDWPSRTPTSCSGASRAWSVSRPATRSMPATA